MSNLEPILELNNLNGRRSKTQLTTQVIPYIMVPFWVSYTSIVGKKLKSGRYQRHPKQYRSRGLNR